MRESHWWFRDESDPATGYFPPKLTIEDVDYRADGEKPGRIWRPSIHMPRSLSRILLEVTDVRVQQPVTRVAIVHARQHFRRQRPERLGVGAHK